MNMRDKIKETNPLDKLDKLGIKVNELTRLMLEHAYNSLIENMDKSKLAKIILEDLEEADKCGVFTELYIPYLIASYDICNKYPNDPFCKSLANLILLLKSDPESVLPETIAKEYSKLKHRNTLMKLIKFKKIRKKLEKEMQKDKEKILKLYDKYEETIKKCSTQ